MQPCDECDGTGIERDDPASPCHLCEGLGWFGEDGFPCDEDDEAE
jgi:DnaJ-class molecular chaperone